MLTPIPGLSQLGVVESARPAEASYITISTDAEDLRRTAGPLVQLALTVAFGIRTPAALKPHLCSPAVRDFAKTHARRHTGRPRIASMHVQPSGRSTGEICGTVLLDDSSRAYTARISHGKLVVFRVL